MNSHNGSQTITLSEMSKEAKEKLFDEIRPKGEWVEIEKQGRTGDGRVFTFTIIVCSNCGEQFDLEGEKFCPHCGAKMTRT